MFFYGVSKFSSTRSYSLSSSLVRNVRRSTALFQVADYAGIAGRVVTTPESRWDVLAVGVIVSPYSMKFDTPKQATISRHDGGAQAGSIKLFPGYEECISNLDGFDFIWVITYMHLNSGFKKKIRPMPREGKRERKRQRGFVVLLWKLVSTYILEDEIACWMCYNDYEGYFRKVYT
jgi:hypothetical protein